jgi:hypothetical protein
MYPVVLLANDALPRLAETLRTVMFGAWGALPVLGLIWLHRAWRRVPAACRMAYDGRRIAPDEAIWKLFIPLYGIYWIFQANLGLCGAVERHLLRSRAAEAKAPSGLALMACLTQLLPVVNLLVSPFLWAFFMTRIDRLQAEAERRDADARALAPLGVVNTIAILLMGWVAVWIVTVVGGSVVAVGIWKFLSPASP